MLTYKIQTETDYRNEISELYHVFSNGKKVMTTIDRPVIDYMVSQGILISDDTYQVTHLFRKSAATCSGCRGEFCKECGQCLKPGCTSEVGGTNPPQHREMMKKA